MRVDATTHEREGGPLREGTAESGTRKARCWVTCSVGKQHAFPATLAITVALGLSGCSGLVTEGPDAINEVTRAPESAASTPLEGIEEAKSRVPIISDATPAKDLKRWTLPTDAYYGGQISRLTSDAHIVARAHCLRKAGYSDYPIHVTPFAPPPETETAGGIGHRFTEEIAATYGYRLAPDPGRIDSVELPDWSNMPEGFADDERACTLKVSARLAGTTVEEYENLLAKDSPLAQLHESPLEQWRTFFTPEFRDIETQLDRLRVDLTSPELTQAAQRWRECMAPLKIIDLPERPWPNVSQRMPDSLRDRWNWETAGDASADEIAIARHDAACRRSSGWFDTLYEQTWSLHEEFMTAHKDELAPLLERHRDNAKRAVEVLASYGYK